MRNTFERDGSGRPNGTLVDDREALRLAEEHGLPPIEVDAALFGESVEHAESVLCWIDREESKLTTEHGLLEGRRRYRPVRMLRSYARKYRTGRYRFTGEGSVAAP